jgi:hypothetical protein
MKKLAYSILSIILLMACRLVTPATPLPPVDATIDTEFMLAPDQVATISGIGLTIKLISVTGDQRCPSELECAVSGPVSVSLTVQMGNGEPINMDLQTFTDNNGRAPSMEFEGIKDRMVYEGYLIRVVGVLPYPQKSMPEIKDAEYHVTLVVSKE